MATSMRIQQIQVSNFKSLVNFNIVLSKFTCLIGLNGAGKSTLLQFIDFLSQLVKGDMTEWLESRGWAKRDVLTHHSPYRTISFAVAVGDDGTTGSIVWRGTYNCDSMRCGSETFVWRDCRVLVSGNRLTIIGLPHRADYDPIPFTYEGSVVSQLRDELIPEGILALKRFFQSAHSLELLSPEHLRTRTRTSGGSLGMGGRQLASFLHELGVTGREQLVQKLQKVYPQLHEFSTKAMRSGWKDFSIQEVFDSQKKWVTNARHANDGLLRLLAIMAELSTDHPIVLFDEIENGINPELVEFLMDELVAARQQIIITTHSPLLLNYLDDSIASQSVIYLYRDYEGLTKAIRFFAIPSMQKKLRTLGPGEVFADTRLTDLETEIEEMPMESPIGQPW